MRMIRSHGSTGLPTFDAIRLWLQRPSAGGPALQFAVHLAGKLRMILRQAGVYIQEFPRSQKAHWAKCPEPNEPGRLAVKIGRKQVASYPFAGCPGIESRKSSDQNDRRRESVIASTALSCSTFVKLEYRSRR